MRLLGTTRNTIQSIRDKTHRDMNTIKPQNPAQLGLCHLEEVNMLLKKYKEPSSDKS